MKITVLAVGKIRESYYADAVREYSKRLSRYAQTEVIEVADEKAPESLSAAQRRMVMEKEGRRLLEKESPSAFRIALCIDGIRMDSVRFSQQIEECKNRGYSHIEFLIGGSLGLSPEAVRSADLKLSFSDMTFPHPLMRVILLEQIYRAFKIAAHEPYHK